MDELGSIRFEGIANTVRRKRSQTSRRPKPESQCLPEGHDLSILLSTQPSDDAKVSSDDNAGYDGSSKRKVFNLNQCASRGFSATIVEGEHAHKKMKKEDGGSSMLYNNGGLEDGIEQGQSGLNSNHVTEGIIAPSRHSAVVGDGVVNESKFKKVKLKMGGVTRTIQTKPTSQATSGSGSATKSVLFSDAPRPRQKLILQVYYDLNNKVCFRLVTDKIHLMIDFDFWMHFCNSNILLTYMFVMRKMNYKLWK